MSPYDESSPKNLPHTTKYAYSMLVSNRTPIINPGEKVEIEIYLSGYGIPEKAKLQILFSFPATINASNPGSVTYSVKFGIDAAGKIAPCGGTPYLSTNKMDIIGITSILNPGYFLDIPTDTIPGWAFPRVMGESAFDTHPPIFLQLNTSPKARLGDYEISLVFTYGDNQNILQDCKTVKFHITNWWERNQWWVGIIGVGIAILSLIATAVVSVLKPN